MLSILRREAAAGGSDAVLLKKRVCGRVARHGDDPGFGFSSRGKQKERGERREGTSAIGGFRRASLERKEKPVNNEKREDEKGSLDEKFLEKLSLLISRRPLRPNAIFIDFWLLQLLRERRSFVHPFVLPGNSNGAVTQATVLAVLQGGRQSSIVKKERWRKWKKIGKETDLVAQQNVKKRTRRMWEGRGMRKIRTKMEGSGRLGGGAQSLTFTISYPFSQSRASEAEETRARRSSASNLLRCPRSQSCKNLYSLSMRCMSLRLLNFRFIFFMLGSL
ncbi:uncharacterized protein LOC120294070 [Eucalyptus grandis]|uniref:uncharacterized protein LOC120294070 n=1 Tax=Eucalyptus grandis TaxID=71139 RepID=UPI00192EA23B|nr:uncharacterized protein LOC120294070 [Eucalyptus grandis]